MGKSLKLSTTKIEDIKLVYAYLERENDSGKSRSTIGLHGKTKFRLKKITADMLRLSVITVYRILDKKEDSHRA